ncbi:MAG TPA: transporter substrate-binding domain-containing protein [Oculatellaceae cyanobacterium]|jgi:polar amino acid transport system substrate-binding protein
MKFKTSLFRLHPLWFLLFVAISFLSFNSNCASAADLEKIKQRGSLIVAVKDNLRPLGFRNTAGNLQGLEIDLAKRLAAEILGNPEAVVLQPVSNRDRLSVIADNKVDLTIARVAATAARSRLVDFSFSYYLDGTTFVTQNPNVRLINDLTRQKIAVIKGSSTIADVKYNLPNAQLVGVDSYEAGRSLLESNQVVAFAADASVLAGWVQEYPQYHLLPSRLSTEALSVVMPRGLKYDTLRRFVNSAIARWQAEGWLKERANYWGLP